MARQCRRRDLLRAVGAAGFVGFAGCGESTRAPPAEWMNTYGGFPTDAASSVIRTDESHYLVAGATASSGRGKDDGWLVELHESGSVRWERTFGGSESDAFWSIVAGHESGYLLAGETESGFDAQRGWLVKVGEDGTEQWSETYGEGDGIPQAWELVATDDGGYAFAGGQTREGAFQQGWVVKVDGRGQTQWERAFGGEEEDFIYDLVQSSDGGFLLAGQRDKANVASGEGWLIKLDGGGSQEWERTYGGDSFDVLRTVVEAHDGGFLLGGGTASDVQGEKARGWLVKVDASGTKEWERTYGGSQVDLVTALMRTTDDAYVFAGRTASLEEPGQHSWLGKVDRSGQGLWERTYGTGAPEDAHDVVGTADGGYLLVGHQSGPMNTDEGPDAWVVKVRGSDR